MAKHTAPQNTVPKDTAQKNTAPKSRLRGWCGRFVRDLASNPVRYAALATAGLLQAWSLAWPWGGQALGWLQVLAQAAAVAALAAPDVSGGIADGAARFKAGFWRGWCFATVWLATTFWWLYVSMHLYGGLPSVLAALAVLLLAAFLALYYALACGVWLWARAGLGAAGQVLLWAVLWLLAELCRGVFFTGFPWGAIGYAHIDGALAGFAPWVGVYGIGALAAVFSGWLYVAGAALVQAMRQRTYAKAGQGEYGRRMVDGWRVVVSAPITAVLLIACVCSAGIWLKRGQIAAYAQAQSAPATRPALRVALLQGNIAQNEKFIPNGGVQTALQWYGEQLHGAQALPHGSQSGSQPSQTVNLQPEPKADSHADSQPDLIVLPETALPLPPAYLPEGYWDDLLHRFATGKQAALIGIPAGNRLAGFTNAIVGLVPGGAHAVGNAPLHDLSLPESAQPAYSYAKHHLVPFGEFVPTGFGWFVRMMRIPLGNLQRGTLVQPRLLLHGERIQPNICYEDLFGEELAASFSDPATAPTMLVNLSNIAWFGDTVAIDQHRHISRMRAIELARPMLRATNTGATAVISPTGQVLHELPRLQRGVLHASVRGVDGQTTFFAQWAAHWGLWPLWVLGAAVAMACCWQARKNSLQPQAQA